MKGKKPKKMTTYPEIRNSNDLKIAYSFIGIIGSNKELKEAIKKEIRKYHNKPINLDRKIIHQNFDSMIALVRLPLDLGSLEDAQNYFINEEYLDMPYSPYDCTGKSFTNWYHLFVRRGRWYAYHSVCRDV